MGIPNNVADTIDTIMKAKNVFVLRTDIKKISNPIHMRIIRNDIGKSIQ